MRYWFDTEFLDDGRTVELVSVGMVAEDGRRYYAISREFEAARANAWVAEHVLPQLDPPDAPTWKSRAQIADDVRSFVGSRNAEFWAYCAAYDWVVLAQLYGPLSDRPAHWPLRCRDVAELAALYPDVPKPPEREGPEGVHHALADAIWAHAYWEALVAQHGSKP